MSNNISPEEDNNLSGIIKPTYYDYDTENDFNDYGKSRTATNELLKDVKAFAKRLKNDLGLEDYYFRGKKRTISTNHTECNVHFVVPQAQAPNNHLHITFYVDHPLRGINYDYTIEEWFPISLGPEHSFGDTCRFHIFDSYEEILRDIKIRYPIFRKPQTKQPEKVSPLFDYAIKLVKLKNGKTLSGTPENSIQKFQENIWKNGLNSVTLKQLDDIINDIQNGKYSLSYGQNIRENRGRIFLAASVISGGGRETNRIIPTSYIQRSEWSERCGQLLEQWAKLEGCWIDNAENYFISNGFIRIDIETGESVVFRDARFTSAIKIMGANYYAGMIDKSIDRVMLHNILFPDTALEIIGFTNHNGRLKIIAYQKFIQGIPASQQDILKFIEDNLKGYDYVSSNDCFIKDGIEISDLHQGNFVKSANGKTYLIDCVIRFTTKTFRGLSTSENSNELEDLLLSINLKNIIVGILSKNGYIQNKDYRIKYFKSSPYWENRGCKNVQECWIYTKYGKAKVDTEDFDDMEGLTDYVCGLIDMNWDGKKQRKKRTKQLFDTIIKLLKIRNKTTKKIHTK